MSPITTTGSPRQLLLIIVTSPRSQSGLLCACFVSKGKCVKDLIRGLTLGYAPIDSFHGLSNVQSIKPNVLTTGA